MKIIMKIKGKLRKTREIRDVNLIAERGMWQVKKQQHQPQNQILSISRSHHSKYQLQNQLQHDNKQHEDKLTGLEKTTFSTDGSFHEAVGKIIVMAEFFALLPVKGVTSASYEHLSFSWFNIRTIYSLSFIMAMLLELGLAFNKVLDGYITFNAVEPIIFRGSIMIVCISFLKLARKWPIIMHHWHNVEKDLPPHIDPKHRHLMSKKIRIVTYVALFLSLIEHILNHISVAYYAQHCPVIEDSLKNYLLISGDEKFYVFKYSIWLATLNIIENLICTFIWNYMDIFVMIVGIALAAKFRQFNSHLEKFKGMQMPGIFWQEQRIIYRNLCMLSERMDTEISLITLIAFSNNFYFICVQLLKSLNDMPHIALASYFYFSLLFLFGRSLAVSLYSAYVHDESRKPLRVLRAVPEESWCVETNRFSHEITSSLIALSGMKFFYLTRQIVLSVTGTIITYVLVLIQFHSNENLWTCDDRYDRLLQNIE